MKNDDPDPLGWALMLLVVLILAVGSGVYYFHAKNECDARGGALIKGAGGIPTCLVLNR